VDEELTKDLRPQGGIYTDLSETGKLPNQDKLI